MRILFTNSTLAMRAGTELYVRDVALALRRQSHDVAVYSPQLGAVANELAATGVEVVDDLDRLARPPDIIHGHHHLETMTALLRFPSVPALYVSHGWVPWEEIPPRHPRILRYFAVDQPTRDAAVQKHGIAADRIHVLPNFVDLDRFPPRARLCAPPRRALVFSNYASDDAHVQPIREACARHGIELDVAGRAAGREVDNPGELLARHDIVFAKGRSAIEAVVVGCAVIVCDTFGVGPMITTQNAMTLRTLNGDYRSLYVPLSADAVEQQIRKYNPADVGLLTAMGRATIGIEHVLRVLLKAYEEILEAYAAAPAEPEAEARAEAAYARWLSVQARDLLARTHAAQAEMERERNSLAYRLRNRVLRLPIIGPLLHRPSVEPKRQ